MSTVYCYHVLNASVKQIQLIVGSCLEKVLVALSAAALKNASLSVLCYLQCSRAKEQIFYFYLIFDRRHVYLLGNTKNQRNNYKLTRDRADLSIQYTLYRSQEIDDVALARYVHKVLNPAY